MSFKRIMQWTCDKCSFVFDNEGTTLPKGWQYSQYIDIVIIVHYCDKCFNDLSKEDKSIFNK